MSSYKSNLKWQQRFLDQAGFIAAWSKDPSTKVGSVIVRPDNTVVSQGFNGFPRGVVDSDERYNNRELKYKMVVHAEANALANARENLHGYILYTSLMPCSVCAGLIIQFGIAKVVARCSDNPRLQESFDVARTMFKEAGVELIEVNK